MSEDEFEHDGKTYIAVDDNSSPAGRIMFGCDKCAIFGLNICSQVPDCTGLDREDGRAVHFEVKQ
jgi:hypothetical protein